MFSLFLFHRLMTEEILDLLNSLTPISEEGDKKIYSGDAIANLKRKKLEKLLLKLTNFVGILDIGTIEAQLETKDLEVSPTTVTLVDREEDPTIGGKKLRLKKKTRRSKRNRRTMKRRQLA